MRSPWDEEEDEPLRDVDSVIELFQTQWDAVAAFVRGKDRVGPNATAYRRRKRLLSQALADLGLRDPFRWDEPEDVWAFGKRWGSYAERQHQVGLLAQPVADRLEALRAGTQVSDWGKSEWTALEERLDGLKDEIAAATKLDEFQDVGRRAREIVIDATNLVFDPTMVPDDGEQPKGSDAKAKIDYIVRALAPGKAHEELRALMRAAEKLSQQVTHASGISRVDAFAAAQATVLLVRTLSEMDRERA